MIRKSARMLYQSTLGKPLNVCVNWEWKIFLLFQFQIFLLATSSCATGSRMINEASHNSLTFRFTFLQMMDSAFAAYFWAYSAEISKFSILVWQYGNALATEVLKVVAGKATQHWSAWKVHSFLQWRQCSPQYGNWASEEVLSPSQAHRLYAKEDSDIGDYFFSLSWVKRHTLAYMDGR